MDARPKDASQERGEGIDKDIAEVEAWLTKPMVDAVTPIILRWCNGVE